MVGDVMALRGGKTLTIFLAADLKKFNRGVNQAQGGIRGLAGSMKNILGPAAIGAGIAVAGLAVKMGVDGVKAALDDEEAVKKLALTLENLGLAHDTEKVEDYIKVLERSLGIADTELRPAYAKLVRALGDTEKAQDALTLSLDISAGADISLTQATDALTRAYAGQTRGITRLNSGIDASIIASGDMNAITEQLSNRFRGQATESADTLRGRMGVLKTAVDNLGEAFGKGLLTGVTNATKGTSDMVKTMGELEPMLESVGEGAANLAGDVVKLGGAAFKAQSELDKIVEQTGFFGTVLDAALNTINPFRKGVNLLNGVMNIFSNTSDDASQAIGFTANEARKAVPQWNNLTGAVRMSTQQYIDFLNANRVGNGIIKDANKDYKDLAARQNVVNTFTHEYTGVQTTATTATGNASKAVETLTKKEKLLTQIHEDKTESLNNNRSELARYTAELQKANDAIDSFTDSMQANLLSGIDLGAAFAGVNSAGEATGLSLLEGFNKQIADAEYFGGVLDAIKTQGADSRLIAEIAGLGPIVGAQLAQEMLDKGLVPELNNRFVHVQDKTRELAEGLIPEFLLAGQNSALGMVDKISETMAKEVTRLAKIGRRIAKPLGQSFKAQLMQDVASALAEVEATGTAARIEKVAQAERRQVNLTNAAVAQALQNLVRSADARNGAPIAPVLS